MRVREMHPLCCISLESPGIGNQSPEASLSRTRSLPASFAAVGSDGNAGARTQGSESTVAGILYKWTNYSKGWRSRWFLLRNGVLSYAKIRWPENLNLLTPAYDVRLIGEISASRLDSGSTMRRKHQKSASGVVHLKVRTYFGTWIASLSSFFLHYDSRNAEPVGVNYFRASSLRLSCRGNNLISNTIPISFSFLFYLKKTMKAGLTNCVMKILNLLLFIAEKVKKLGYLSCNVLNCGCLPLFAIDFLSLLGFVAISISKFNFLIHVLQF